MNSYDPKSYHSDVKLLGKRLFKLASNWSKNCPDTIKERKAAVDKCPGRKKFATKKALIEITKKMEILARQMIASRVAHKSGCRGRRGSRASMFGCDQIPIISRRSLEQRKEDRRKRLILDAAAWQIESYSGTTDTIIGYGEPAAHTSTYLGTQYSRSSPWSKTNATHFITVHPDWFSRVHLHGLDEAGSMLTLDAELVDTAAYTVYRASWLRSKGKRLTVEHGYIAVGAVGGSLGAYRAAHAKTATGAKAILTRRENERRYDQHERKIRVALQEMQLKGYAQIDVSMMDSIAAGNCQAGTEQFRDRHFPGRDTATVEEILSVESMRSLAISACLYAIRRAKFNHSKVA